MQLASHVRSYVRIKVGDIVRRCLQLPHRAEGYASPVSVSVEELSPMQLPLQANNEPLAAHLSSFVGNMRARDTALL